MVLVFKVHSLQLRTLGSLQTIRQEGCCDVKRERDGVQWLVCRAAFGSTDHRVIRKELQANGQYTVQAVYVENDPPAQVMRIQPRKDGWSIWKRWKLEIPEEPE